MKCTINKRGGNGKFYPLLPGSNPYFQTAVLLQVLCEYSWKSCLSILNLHLSYSLQTNQFLLFCNFFYAAYPTALSDLNLFFAAIEYFYPFI